MEWDSSLETHLQKIISPIKTRMEDFIILHLLFYLRPFTIRKYLLVIFLFYVKRDELPLLQSGCKNVIELNIVMFPVYALHHTQWSIPEYFPNSDKSSIPKGSAMETKTTFYQTLIYHLVFHGSRKCIGNRFVLMETKILIAHLLQKFTLKTTKKTIESVV